MEYWMLCCVFVFDHSGNCSSLAAFHMGPGWAKLGPNWAHLGMLLGLPEWSDTEGSAVEVTGGTHVIT